MANRGNKISDWLTDAALSAKSLVKIMLQSHKSRVHREAEGETLIVMGNGPSLAEAIRNHSDVLRSYPTLAVNFAANADEFSTLRPRYYVMADPHFFSQSADPNVERLQRNLAECVDWKMTLFIPFGVSVPAALTENPSLEICRFNFVGAEGFPRFANAVYSSGRAMPRPRNVLVPSLMIGLWLGYRYIFVAGADHSWTRTLEVNEHNEVVSVQPHFYKDNDSEHSRVASVYANVRLHEIIYSFYVAFKAYFDVERFARSIGAVIYNATPGSFIDAFPRRDLSTLRTHHDESQCSS